MQILKRLTAATLVAAMAATGALGQNKLGDTEVRKPSDSSVYMTWNESQLGVKLYDAVKAILGTDQDYQIRFDSASGDILITDGTNTLVSISDEGTTANVVVSGDVAVNGGDITSSAATFGLVDVTPTTVNFARAATALNAGANSGTFTLGNPTVLGTQTTQNLWNTVATTVNLGGAATALTMGALTGTAAIRNPAITLGPGNAQAYVQINGSTSTAKGFQLASNASRRWNVAALDNETGSDAGSNLKFDAYTDAAAYIDTPLVINRIAGGNFTVYRPTVIANSNLSTNQTTMNVFNANATTVNAFGAASVALNIGNASAAATFPGGISIADAKNIVAGSTTGTKIGTATTQKLGLWNATPVVQPSSTGEATGYTGGGGTALTHTDTFTGNSGTKAYTINDIVKHLKAAGILAAS